MVCDECDKLIYGCGIYVLEGKKKKDNHIPVTDSVYMEQ